MDETDSTNTNPVEPDRWTSIRISTGTRRRLDAFRAELMRHGTKNLPQTVASALPDGVTSYTPDLLLQLLLGAGEHLLTAHQSKGTEDKTQQSKRPAKK